MNNVPVFSVEVLHIVHPSGCILGSSSCIGYMHLYTTQPDFVSGKIVYLPGAQDLEKPVRITDVFLTICITSTNLLGVYYKARPWGIGT